MVWTNPDAQDNGLQLTFKCDLWAADPSITCDTSQTIKNICALWSGIFSWPLSVTLIFELQTKVLARHTIPSWLTFIPNNFVILQRMSKMKPGQIWMHAHTTAHIPNCQNWQPSLAQHKRALQTFFITLVKVPSS